MKLEYSKNFHVITSTDSWFAGLIVHLEVLKADKMDVKRLNRLVYTPGEMVNTKKIFFIIYTNKPFLWKIKYSQKPPKIYVSSIGLLTFSTYA